MIKFESINLDANESAFFERELEHVKAKTYDKMYPEYKATRLIPVSTDAGPGAESITYQQFDAVGVMKLISSYADDLPRADVKGQEFTSPVRSFGGSYGWNLQEVRSAAMAGRPLQTRKADAARQAWEQLVNKIAWFARSSDGVYGGIQGILYNPNITVASADTGTWSTASSDEIIEDVNKAIRDQVALTKGVEVPDTCLLPIAQFQIIATKPRSTQSDTTVLEFLQKNYPNMTFEWVNELNDVSPKPSAPSGSGTTDCMVIYKRSPDKMTLEIPQLFEQLPAQERNLEFVVPTHGRCGGVIIYYPLSVTVIEGI